MSHIFLSLPFLVRCQTLWTLHFQFCCSHCVCLFIVIYSFKYFWLCSGTQLSNLKIVWSTEDLLLSFFKEVQNSLSSRPTQLRTLLHIPCVRWYFYSDYEEVVWTLELFPLASLWTFFFWPYSFSHTHELIWTQLKTGGEPSADLELSLYAAVSSPATCPVYSGHWLPWTLNLVSSAQWGHQAFSGFSLSGPQPGNSLQDGGAVGRRWHL